MRQKTDISCQRWQNFALSTTFFSTTRCWYREKMIKKSRYFGIAQLHILKFRRACQFYWRRILRTDSPVTGPVHRGGGALHAVWPCRSIFSAFPISRWLSVPLPFLRVSVMHRNEENLINSRGDKWTAERSPSKIHANAHRQNVQIICNVIRRMTLDDVLA